MGFNVANSGTLKNHSTGAAASGLASSGSGFIPEIWAGKLIEKFYKNTVFGEIANTDYEGEITSHGDKVIIRTNPNITISNYIKGGGLTYENPSSASVELLINKGKYFAFNMFDIDKYQSDLNLMNNWSDDGGEQMKIAVDTDVLATIGALAGHSGATAGDISGDVDLGVTTAPLALSKTNVLDAIVDYGTVLDEANVPESGRYLVMPARYCGLIKKSDLKDASITGDNTSVFRNGRLGMLDRFTVYSSNSLPAGAVSGESSIYFGHKSALTFASQITEMEDLANPDDFGRLVRSLMVYGFEVIKPESLGHSVVSLA